MTKVKTVTKKPAEKESQDKEMFAFKREDFDNLTLKLSVVEAIVKVVQDVTNFMGDNFDGKTVNTLTYVATEKLEEISAILDKVVEK